MIRLSEHIGFLVILVAFFALGALYLRVTPLLETPDEPSHFSVAKYIADEARLPPAQPAPPDIGPVPIILPGPPIYYAPPLYYVLGALLITDLDTSDFAQSVIPNPNWTRGWAPTPGRSPENKHIYIHTADQHPPYAGWALGMIRLRIFSLLLGGATVVGVYSLARTLWCGYAALAATALVAFNPAFLFVTIGVTNDALLVALSTWAFVLMAQLVSGSRTSYWRQVAFLAVVLGLAALTKQSALALLPVAALAVIWSDRHHSQARSAALKRLLFGIALITALAGWWYLDNALNYGDPLGFRPHQPPTDEWTPPLSLLARQLGQALRGYWGAFGWGLILVEPIIYVGFALFSLVGFSGLVASGLAASRQQRSHTEFRVVIILILGLLLNLAGLLLWLWRTSAPYGRLLFPTLGPLAVLLVMGWRHCLRQRYGRLFAWVVALTLGLYTAVVPWRYLRPAYASPVISLSTPDKAKTLDIQFDESLHLLGYRTSSNTATAGDEVTLTLYWQATAQLDDDLIVFVQLAPMDPEKRVAGLDDFLGSSRYPSSVWQAGEVIEQHHQIRLPDDAATPTLYWFNVGLYGEAGDERLPVTADGAAVPSRAVRLGPLRVTSQETQQPDKRVDYRFGSAIRLSGYDVQVMADSTTSEPQGLKAEYPLSITITLYWEATATLEDDWVVFVHLLDAEGHLVTQDDGPPRQGDYPVWAWQEGDRIPDSHTLPLPPDQKPGVYRLLVGLYRPHDITRMPVFDGADQRLPDDTVILTQITLSGENEGNGN